MKTALTFAVLATALAFVVGSNWAQEPQEREESLETDPSVIAEELSKRLSERLSGKEPGQVPVDFPGPGSRWDGRILMPPPSRSTLRPCLAQGGGASDLCAVAEELSRMGPCVEPWNCRAYDTWRQFYGLEAPRIVPAEPAPPAEPALAAAKDDE